MLVQGKHAIVMLMMLMSVGLLFTSCQPVTNLFSEQNQILRLATTTSLDDSGLLDTLLPLFEEQENIETEVIAVGTGQALSLGERGDVDVLLVHAPELEQQFIDDSFGVRRIELMRNQFIVVGPENDPAGIADALNVQEIFTQIAETSSAFVSRGDDSGTHIKEGQIWQESGVRIPDPAEDWYYAAGQGMGETLLMTDEIGAYTLTDQATYLSMRGNLPNTTLVAGKHVEGDELDPLLNNPYSIVELNPDRFPDLNHEGAQTLMLWLQSDDARNLIRNFGNDEYGTSLFQVIDG